VLYHPWHDTGGESLSVRSLFGGIVNDTPVPLASRWAGRGMLSGFSFGQRSRENDLAAFTATATLYGVVTTLARMTSAVEWDLCRKPASPGDDPVPLTGTRAENAAPLKVWNRPNDFMTRQLLVAGSQQHKDLCGEFWWVVVKFGGIPVELWPVRPDRMFPVPSTTKFLAGYIYRSPDGEEIPLDVDDVLTSFLPSPMDPYRGEGPIGALAKDLAQNDAQARWQASLYRNSANPGGIINVGRRLGDTEWEELVERWRMQHQGVHNAGRVAVLEEGDFTPLSYTQKDMQFVETRGLTRQAILDAYAFPKFGIGDVDDVNRASADASMALMARTLTTPRVDDIKSLLNHRFLPMFGPLWRNYMFHPREIVPPDAESERADLTTRTTAFATLIGARVKPDQAAEVCGLPPLELEDPEPVVVQPMPGQDPNADPNEEDPNEA
jgi:phage portal protein BeeE